MPVRPGHLRPRIAVALLALVASAVVVAPAPPVGASPSAPVVSVSRWWRLEGGDVIVVRAGGLPPTTAVRISQCVEEPFPPLGTGCAGAVDAVTDAAGRLRVEWSLLDVVWYQPEFGDSRPRYCRADQCAIWVTVIDTNVSTPSRPLHLVGSPATVAVTPSTDLVDGQRVRITGSAKGSTGRWIRIVQQACVDIVQEFSCFGSTTLGHVRLGHHDTFATHLRVRRFLVDGTECAAGDFDRGCRITAVVLRNGEPDDSFGVSRLGQPGVVLTFAPAP